MVPYSCWATAVAIRSGRVSTSCIMAPAAIVHRIPMAAFTVSAVLVNIAMGVRSFHGQITDPSRAAPALSGECRPNGGEWRNRGLEWRHREKTDENPAGGGVCRNGAGGRGTAGRVRYSALHRAEGADADGPHVRANARA